MFRRREGFNYQTQVRFPSKPSDRLPSGRPTDLWTIYDSTFADYLDTFGLVDKERLLVKRLCDVKNEGRPPVVIDFMSNPAAIIGMHRSILCGFPVSGLAVGHEFDNYSPQDGVNDDERQMVSYLPSNLEHNATWQSIYKWLDGRKVDLLLERGYGAFYFIPNRLLFYKPVIARCWNMLNANGGVMAVQTPPFDVFVGKGIQIYNWIKKVRNSGINIRSVDSFHSRDAGLPYGLLLLQKEKEQELPAI